MCKYFIFSIFIQSFHFQLDVLYIFVIVWDKHLLDFIMVLTAIFITVYEFEMEPMHILYSFPISVQILILGVEFGMLVMSGVWHVYVFQDMWPISNELHSHQQFFSDNQEWYPSTRLLLSVLLRAFQKNYVCVLQAYLKTNPGYHCLKFLVKWSERSHLIHSAPPPLFTQHALRNQTYRCNSAFSKWGLSCTNVIESGIDYPSICTVRRW